VKIKAKKDTVEQDARIFDTVSDPVTFFPCTLSFLYDIKGYTQWRTEGEIWGLQPGNSEGSLKSCQNQPDCENF